MNLSIVLVLVVVIDSRPFGFDYEHEDDDEDECRGSWRALFRFLRMHWDDEPSTERSADSLVRESWKFGSRGHGCPRSWQWFMEREKERLIHSASSEFSLATSPRLTPWHPGGHNCGFPARSGRWR